MKEILFFLVLTTVGGLFLTNLVHYDMGVASDWINQELQTAASNLKP
jgi:hypothetical protein